MAGSGGNLAITKDGGAYNKLQRPDNFLDQANIAPPPRKTRPIENSTVTSVNKRKLEYQQGVSQTKRTKVEDRASKETGHRNTNGTSNRSRDVDYGMRTVLPASDDEEHSSEGTVDEAMAYLRSVRSEASTIPHLLKAGTDPSPDDHVEEDAHQILYHDGTWIAVDETTSDYADQDSVVEFNDPDPQDRLYELLLKRFYALREKLSGPRVKSNHEYTKRNAAQEGPRAWIDVVEQDYPDMSRVQSMKADTIFRTIETCTHAISRLTSDSISPNLSCWIWTLLAAVRNVETLDHEKVSKIRDLGMKLGFLRKRLREIVDQDSPVDIVTAERQEQSQSAEANTPERIPDSAHNDDMKGAEVQEGGESDAEMSMSEDGEIAEQDDASSGLEQARARLLAQLGDRLVQVQPESSQKESQKESQKNDDDQKPDAADVNTRATIDMVLTVAAECFGQKDLLSYRERW